MSKLKVNWWDFSWHSEESLHSTGTRRLVRQLACFEGIQLRLVGLPRNPVGVEYAPVTRLNDDLRREEGLREEVRRFLRNHWGPDLVHGTLETCGERLLREYPLPPCDVSVVRAGPAGFPEPKLTYALAVARAAICGPVLVLDEDASCGGTLDLARFVLQRAHVQRPFEAATVGPHATPYEGFRHLPMLWPVAFEDWLAAVPPSDPNKRWDLGYVGNHWAASGSNAPHVEKFFTPGAGQTAAILGDWPADRRPNTPDVHFGQAVRPREVTPWYNLTCRATIMMRHAHAKRVHITPRFHEAVAAGVPMFFDDRLSDVLRALGVSSVRVGRESEQLAAFPLVNSGAELFEKLAEVSDNEKLYLDLVSRQRMVACELDLVNCAAAWVNLFVEAARGIPAPGVPK